MIRSPRVKGVIGLLMLVLLFGMYSLGHSAFSLPNDAHYAYIPAHASYLIEVQTEQIFKETAHDLLASDKDSNLLRLLNDKIGETKWSDLGSQGIDPRADVLLFACEEEGFMLYGQLLVLNEADKFRENFLPSLDPEFKCAVIQKDCALLLSQNEPHFKANELEKIAKKLMHGPHLQLSDAHANGLVHIHSFAKKKTSQSTIHCTKAQHALHFDGEIELTSEAFVSENVRALSPEGFHFTSRLVPLFLSELGAFEMPIPLSDVSVLSLNYRGTEINTDQSPQIMPDIDLLIHYTRDFDVRQFLDSLVDLKLIHSLKDDRFQSAGHTFYYRQFAKNQIYIGRRLPGELKALDKRTAFRVSGKLEDLTKMKTSGIIGRFIEMLPIYVATQECVKNCEGMELTGTIQGRKIKIEGSLDFKEKHHFTTELLRFLLLAKFM